MPKKSKMTDEQRAEYDKKMSEARSAAASTLREAHRSEYHGYLITEAKERGIDWKPQPTKEERAAAEMKRLLEQYPELATQVAQPKAGDEISDAGVPVPEDLGGMPEEPDKE